MVTILLPVDGSKPSDRAVKHVIDLARRGMPVDVVLLNVLPKVFGISSRERKRAQMVTDIHATDRATRSATVLLDDAQLPYRAYTLIGAPADTILKFAKQRRCDQIVMGTRGLGAVAGLVLGSVAMKVLQLANIPVTLVK
jgi:nucleotide-binding universal stress UspA family protein